MAEPYKERLSRFNDCLQADEICLKELRQLCKSGIPEDVRTLCWKLLLDYLPSYRPYWVDFLEKQRRIYDELVLDLVIKADTEPSTAQTHSATDHPLSTNPSSQWSEYFKDNETLLQIDKDVRRLCPEISFFQQATDYPCIAAVSGESTSLSDRVATEALKSLDLKTTRSGAANLVSGRKVAAEEYGTLMGGSEAHWQVVERILFIYSKLNPGVRYVQGMNEIIGPIYYVFACDSDTDSKKFAEADTYYCFQNVMSEIKDNFIMTLDSSSCGIESTMSKFYEYLAVKDAKLHEHMTAKQRLLPQFYAFRWLSLLLSQEFLLPDVIRLWDSLFADEKRFEFLLYVCLAMLINVRDDLLLNDFSANMKLLQNYPPTDVARLVQFAAELQNPLCRVRAQLADSAQGKSPKASVWSRVTGAVTQ